MYSLCISRTQLSLVKQVSNPYMGGLNARPKGSGFEIVLYPDLCACEYHLKTYVFYQSNIDVLINGNESIHLREITKTQSTLIK